MGAADYDYICALAGIPVELSFEVLLASCTIYGKKARTSKRTRKYDR